MKAHWIDMKIILGLQGTLTGRGDTGVLKDTRRQPGEEIF